jgi:hypothetical protein
MKQGSYICRIPILKPNFAEKKIAVNGSIA